MADNKQIKDGLGNLFAVRMRDVSPLGDGSVQQSMQLASLIPQDYGNGGMYAHVAKSGVMPNAVAMTSAPIYSFHWPGGGTGSAPFYAFVRRVRLSVAALNVFAAGIATFEIFAARNFTNLDSGGTTTTFTAPNNQMRTTMAASRTTIMVANTAPLSPGVRTLDAAPLDSQSFVAPVTYPAMFSPSRITLFERLEGEHALMLANNEGFVVRTTLPAGGPWQFTVTTEWDEYSVAN
jgi:hypothetical protein